MLNGGCYCGAIRYRVSDRISKSTNCHCEICRRTTGAPCVAWTNGKLAWLKLADGLPQYRRSRSEG